MGNSESSNPIRNMDKRTARREYREAFVAAISNYQQSVRPNRGDRKKAEPKVLDWGDGNIRVFVRKRPIFKHETDNFEFDVATCLDKSIIIHDARMHADMKRQMMSHNTFEFDQVFDEFTNNDSVYTCTAKSLVDVTLNGGFSTCLVYGQTGSGKTFTMTSIYEKAARDIFSQIDKKTERFAPQPIVSLSFFEIAGDRCSDLLNGFTAAQLLAGPDGNVHAFPVVEPTVTCADDLIAMISHGMSIRTTAATGVHDASSRSHAILRIYVNRVDNQGRTSSYGNADAPEGTLTLVDLAGSEHRIDSMYHGKERRKETGNINASLMALKECIRARAAGKNLSHQYRKSKLTMALKASFTVPLARTIVIATVSPASKDTEHSLNTLRHACIMHGQQDAVGGGASDEKRFVTGGSVVTEMIGEVNLTALARQNRMLKKAGEVIEAKTNNGNTVESSKKAKEANKEVELTDKEKEAAKRAAERRAYSKLTPELKQLLTYHRTQLASEPRQLARLRRNMNDILPRFEEPLEVDEDEDDESIEDTSHKHHTQNKKSSSGGGGGGGRLQYNTGGSDEEIEDNVKVFHNSLTKNRKPLNNGREEIEEDIQYQDDFDNDEDEEELAVQNSCGNSYGRRPLKPSQSSVAGKKDPKRTPPPPPPAGSVPPPPESPSRYTVGSRNTVGSPPAAVDSRVSFKSVYDSIYVAAGSVPEEILKKQLVSILKLHGYSEAEVLNLLAKQEYVNKQKQHVQSLKTSSSVASGSSRSNRVPAQNSPPPASQYSDGFVEERVQITPRGRAAPSQVQQQQQQQQQPSMSGGGGSAKVIHTPRGVDRGGEQQPAPVSARGKAGSGNTPPPSSNTSSSRLTKPAKQQNFQTRFDNSEYDSAQITESEKQKQREQQIAEERERRRQEGIAEAKKKLEQEAAVRKQRQEAAKKLREEQEQARLAKARRNLPPSAVSAGGQMDEPESQYPTSSSSAKIAMVNPYSNMDTNEYHREEIARLTQELEQEGITSTMKFALRKNIRAHKDALEKDLKAMDVLNAPPSAVAPVPAAATRVESKVDSIQETVNESPDQYRRRTRPADKSRYALPVQQPAVPSVAPTPAAVSAAPLVRPPNDASAGYDSIGNERYHQQRQAEFAMRNNSSNYHRGGGSNGYEREESVGGVPYNRSNSGNSYGMSYHQSNYDNDYNPQAERDSKLDNFRSQFESYERNGSSASLSAREYGSRQQTLAQYVPQQRQQQAMKQDFDDLPIRGQQPRPSSYDMARQGVTPAAASVVTNAAPTRITRHRVVGASAAPFANDYSWNVGEN